MLHVAFNFGLESGSVPCHRILTIQYCTVTPRVLNTRRMRQAKPPALESCQKALRHVTAKLRSEEA